MSAYAASRDHPWFGAQIAVWRRMSRKASVLSLFRLALKIGSVRIPKATEERNAGAVDVSRPSRWLPLAQAPIRGDRFTGDKGCRIRNEPQHGSRVFVRRAESA